MSFANPLFFWAFLSLIPLIAIYLLKVRPVRKPTTAYFLWENIFQEKKATSLFQRFRDLLSLLMMALAFVGIVLALTRPDFDTGERKDLILLIDNSASMNTKEGGSTRLDKAKNVARQIVRALNGTQRCSLAAVSNETVYFSHLSDNPRVLLDAINKIESSSMPSRLQALDSFRQTPSDNNPPLDYDTSITEGNLDPNESSNSVTPKLASSGDSIQHRVIMITDGCMAGTIPDEIELLKVGNPNASNLGLIASDIQRLPGGNNRVGVFFQVASTFDETVDAELTLYHSTQINLVKLVPLEIKPGINSADVMELENAEEGKWFMQIDAMDASDSLDDDNTAFLSLPPKRPIPVTVVATNRFFFENSVLAFSKRSGLLQLADPDSKNAQLMIGQGNFEFDNSTAPDLLIFQPEGESKWWNDLGEEIEVALPRTLDESHPVVRHIDATTIPFVGAKRLMPPPGSEIWVAAEDDTPLIYRTTNAGRTAIVVNLDPLASDFVFSAWFPVLVYSSATHLAGRTEAIHSTYPTGQFANIPGAQAGQKTTIQFPKANPLDEEKDVLEVTEPLFGPLRQLGHYELKNNSGDWVTGSSLLAPAETNVNNEDVVDNSKPVKRGLSLTALLTLVAIVVVVLESILYQRRKVG